MSTQESRRGLDLESLCDGVAVITGGASGLGLALAEKCCELGVRGVVIADIRRSALDDAVKKLRNRFGEPLHRENVGITKIEGVECDVGDMQSVAGLAATVQARFWGIPVRFLAANAGVLMPKSGVLDADPTAWERTFRVNALGVANTLFAFMPILQKQDGVAGVEITSSIAGVVNGTFGAYGASKHASLAIAEALLGDLRACREHKRIHVVALCPAFVKTSLATSGLEQHASGKEDADTGEVSSFLSVHGMPPSTCANAVRSLSAHKQVFQHLSEGRFYCILDNDLGRDGIASQAGEAIAARADAMVKRRSPPVIADALSLLFNSGTSKL